MTWKLPELGILAPAPVVDAAPDERDPTAVHAALDGAGISVQKVTTLRAPQVDRYLVQLAPGVDPKKVERAADVVAVALRHPVRYAGVHDGNVVIEANREVADVVNLRSLIEASPALISLGVPLGIAADAAPLTARLADMPHMLVAGTTGAGKSAFLTSTLTALLLRNSPDDLRLTLIDPKRVELAAFASAPHVTEAVTEAAHSGPVLRRLVDMMDQRYDLFEAAGVKSISEYNGRDGDFERLPRHVLVVDELADLMLKLKTVEALLVRLATLGRAAGIHLVLATQHPEARVLTAQLRLNIPARVVFAVQSHVASNVCLGYSGAEKLRGQGDGLFKAPSVGEPIRFQAPLVSAADVERVVTYWKRNDWKRRIEAPSPARPQPVDSPVDDDSAELRAEVDAWRAAQVNEATSSLTPQEILSDAGLSPLVVDALVVTLAERLAPALRDALDSIMPTGTDSGGE